MLTGKERMAARAYFDFDIVLGGSSFNYISTGTADCGFIILRMDTLFHSATLITNLGKKINFLILVNGKQSATHVLDELIVRLGMRNFIQQELHSIYGVHRMQDLAKNPQPVQHVLRK